MSSRRSVLTAAYAVRPSKRPASMLKTFIHGLNPVGVTSFQVTPPSVVVLMTPSSVPIQMRLTSTYDGAME